MHESDIHWLAGLLEGEGCFGNYPGKRGVVNPQVAIWMCDEDVISRAVSVFGGNVTYRRKKVQAEPQWKPQWGYVWTGADAIKVMWAVLPHMGKRRTGRIVEVLAEWYEYHFVDCSRCGTSFYAPNKARTLCSDECRAQSRADTVRRFDAKKRKVA